MGLLRQIRALLSVVGLGRRGRLDGQGGELSADVAMVARMVAPSMKSYERASVKPGPRSMVPEIKIVPAEPSNEI